MVKVDNKLIMVEIEGSDKKYYFTGKGHAARGCGLEGSANFHYKISTGKKFLIPAIKQMASASLVDGSEVKYKDINNIIL